jgi:hypothetical protein
MRKKTHAQHGVSEIVSTVLLLGISITLFGVLNFIVFSFSFGTPPPSVSLISTIDQATDDIIIEHYNGDSLNLTTDVVIRIGDTIYRNTVGDLLLDTNTDQEWNFGEKIQFHSPESISDKYVQVTVVDITTNSILLTTVLQQGT